jgi:hypothetical protein
MRVAFAPFWLHKDGGEPRDYEDAFAPASVDVRPLERLRCAVADGATESLYSRTWARQLASGFASGRLTAPDLVELPVIGRRWARSVAHAQARQESQAWYLERKLEEGAFAALIGLEFESLPRRPDAGTYTAIALGDCCFVQVRGDRLFHAFPLENAAAFDSRPVLLPSRPAAADAFADAIAREAGCWEPGDRFYVMSDALACWFLASTERGERPWRELDRFTRAGRAGFRAWVHALRASALKNDDVTLLRIALF